MNEEPHWDVARVALAELGRLMEREPEADLGRLADRVEHYDQIPEPVRDQLESLTDDQRSALVKTIRVLADNHFYLENPGGAQEFL